MAVTYRYTARRKDGEFVAGSMEAESYDRALEHLRNRALYITSLDASVTPQGAIVAGMLAVPIDGASRVALFRSLSTLVASGVSLRRSLSVTIEQCRSARLREALRSVANDIESGSSLSDALARRPREFPELFTAMIRAGEISGTLDAVLDRLAELLERERSLQKRLSAAFAYPLVVAITAIGLVVFLVGSTVPAFAQMFSQMHVPLPMTTRLLIALGNAMKYPMFWVFAAGFVVSTSAAAALARKHEGSAARIERASFALPVVGSVLRKIAIARLSRALGSMLHSGVPILSSLDAVANVASSSTYRAVVRSLADALRMGEPLSAAFERSKQFDALFLQLVRVGEESGSLDAMLLRIAHYYEGDIEAAAATMGSIAEPLMIVVLGAVVGTIVGSILIPLYSIIGSIK